MGELSSLLHLSAVLKDTLEHVGPVNEGVFGLAHFERIGDSQNLSVVSWLYFQGDL